MTNFFIHTMNKTSMIDTTSGISDTETSYINKRDFYDMISNIDVSQETKIDKTDIDTAKTAVTTDTTSICSDITTVSEIVTLIDDILTDKVTKRVKINSVDFSEDSTILDIFKTTKIDTNKEKVERMKKLCAKKNTRKSTKKWSDADKNSFYDGLRYFGLNYDMICATFLKDRSTRDVARFLKKEDIKNSNNIDNALDINKKNKFLMNEDTRNMIMAMV